MHNKAFSFYSAVFISFFFALLGSIYPLSAEYAWLRPEFVALLLLYWVLYAPQHIGLGFAWSIGLIQDMVEGCVWGSHALALTMLAYFCLNAYQRLRNYVIAHQCLWVFVLVGLHQVFAHWMQGLDAGSAQIHLLLLPTFVSALCWPLLVVLMQAIGRYYRFSSMHDS